jgi:hypothetical protein
MLKVALIAALLLLVAPPAASALDVTVHREPCPAYGGSCADVDTGEAWIEPGAGRFTYWHEIGHHFDHQLLTAEQRSWFIPRLGFDPAEPWDQGTGPGTRGPSEVFADAYATCRMRAERKPKRKPGAWATSRSDIAYGWNAGPRRTMRVCTAIAVLDYLSR